MTRRLLAAALVAAAVVLALAAPASAHAQLDETTPSNGAVLASPPGAIELRFSERVEAGLGAVRLFDAEGTRVDIGAIRRSGHAVRVALPDLDDGGYVVTWRVISGDGHPVRGAFTFRVGPAATDDRTADLARRLLASSGTSRLTGALHALARFGAFAGIVLLVGVGVFALGTWPGGHRERRLTRLATTGWWVALGATVAGIPLQGAYAGGLGLGDAFKPGAIGDVLGTRFGAVWAVRIALLLVAVPVLLALRQRGPTRALVAASALLGIGLLATPGLSSHAAAGDLVPFAVLADIVHVGAASVWIGGLAAMTFGVLRAGEATAAQVAPRYSSTALWAVVAIVATGTFHTWRQVGSLDALTSTTFGQLLLVKLGAVAVLIALGAYGRRLLHAGRATPPTIARLRRSVGVEVVIGVAVLAITALLVNVPPGRDALAQPRSLSLAGKAVLVDMTIDPAKRGPVDFHVYTLTPEGAVLRVEALTLELRQPDRDVGPLPVRLTVAGPGHYAAYGYDLPLSGTWELTVNVRLSDFDQERLDGQFTAR